MVKCELGDVVDLSRSGMRISAKGKPPIRLRQTAMATLKFNGRQVKVQVQARWIKRRGLRRHHIGLMFLNVSDSVANVIESVAKYGFICDDPELGSVATPKAKKQSNRLVTMTLDLPDYYQMLDVGRDASEDELQNAYRRLAQAYHPDINKAPDAEERFIEIKRAYEILSDPEQRESYDRHLAA